MKVIEFKKDESASGENVVERLEECLAMAKDGLIKNVLVLAITNNDDVLDCWANHQSPFVVVGGIESLKLDFMNSVIERR